MHNKCFSYKCKINQFCGQLYGLLDANLLDRYMIFSNVMMLFMMKIGFILKINNNIYLYEINRVDESNFISLYTQKRCFVEVLRGRETFC